MFLVAVVIIYWCVVFFTLPAELLFRNVFAFVAILPQVQHKLSPTDGSVTEGDGEKEV